MLALNRQFMMAIVILVTLLIVPSPLTGITTVSAHCEPESDHDGQYIKFDSGGETASQARQIQDDTNISIPDRSGERWFRVYADSRGEVLAFYPQPYCLPHGFEYTIYETEGGTQKQIGYFRLDSQGNLEFNINVINEAGWYLVKVQIPSDTDDDSFKHFQFDNEQGKSEIGPSKYMKISDMAVPSQPIPRDEKTTIVASVSYYLNEKSDYYDDSSRWAFIGEFVIGLRYNGEIVDKKEVTIESGAQRTISFSYRFDSGMAEQGDLTIFARPVWENSEVSVSKEVELK